jgi:hypothetical protein
MGIASTILLVLVTILREKNLEAGTLDSHAGD